MPYAVDSSVSIGIVGDDLDPGEVSRMLGCEPTLSNRKGEPFSRDPMGVALQAGSWQRKAGLPASAGVERKISSILDELIEDPAVWAELNRRFRTRVYCGVLMDSFIESFTLSAELLGRLSARGLRIDFFIFAPDENSQGDAPEP